jgi:D-alanyl-D-alanine carboxypeptidase/D-alanyl-D-alanine-endopeptidase (penicillin-binding protein 4)
MNEYWGGKLSLDERFFSVDGCGLSRKNLISPEIMNKLLVYVLNQKKYSSNFLNSLPVAGKSGTLKYLGKGTVIENNFIGKSGSMDGVRCYSGYFFKNNYKYPFTIMVNNFSCSSSQVKSEILRLMNGIYTNL